MLTEKSSNVKHGSIAKHEIPTLKSPWSLSSKTQVRVSRAPIADRAMSCCEVVLTGREMQRKTSTSCWRPAVTGAYERPGVSTD